MNFLLEHTLSAPGLALATTLHLALAALINDRHSGAASFTSLAFVSVLFGGAPWVFPSGSGVISALGLHALWFGICERWSAAASRSAGPSPSTPPSSAGLAARSVATPRRESVAGASRASKGFVAAPVLSALDETADIRTFRVARPPEFDFQPGQFLTVRVRADGRELVRCYSISSPPEARGYLEISVKKQGVVSGALHACARPGSMLTVRAPAGGFVYPADDDRPLVLLAGGIGITPLISMLRHAVLVEPSRPVSLLYAARTEAELAFRDDLESMAHRSPRVRVTLAASRGSTSTSIYPGRLDRTLLQTVPDLRDSIACLCGPQAMVDDLSALLEEEGVPRSRIRAELFEAAVAGSSKWRHEQGDGGPVDGARAQATLCRMRASRSGREVEVAPGQTLLEAAESNGIAVESLCRAGVCGTCRTRVTAGEVNCRSDLIDDADRRAGYVLACVTTPRGDIEVEL